MIISFIILLLEFISIIIVIGILSEFLKPFDIIIKDIVVKIYEFGKSIGKSIKNVINNKENKM